MDERISRPLFVLLKQLYQLCQKDDKRRHPLFSLLLEMYNRNERIGYLLLFYLKTWYILLSFVVYCLDEASEFKLYVSVAANQVTKRLHYIKTCVMYVKKVKKNACYMT